MKKRILITGADGFVGRATCAALSKKYIVQGTVRSNKRLLNLPSDITGIVTDDLSLMIDWKSLLQGTETVIHLAARVHQMREDRSGSMEAYQRINVSMTETLANASSQAGVRRLIFISSVKAMGESTRPGEAWNESSPCDPQDAYGRSKHDAERILTDIGKKTSLEVVILRLPLVYGPGVKGNIARLLTAVSRGIPLPLGGIHNQRSLLYLDNLVDAIRVSIEHPAAAGETFLVSDGEDCSTPKLIRLVGLGINRPVRMFHFPPSIIRLAGRIFGKGAEVERLLGSLVVDIGKIRQTLSWNPPYTMEQGLKRTAHFYRTHEHEKSV